MALRAEKPSHLGILTSAFYHGIQCFASLISNTWLAVQEPKRLEDLTGLTAMHAAAEALEDFAFQDSDDDGAASDADEWTTL